MIRSLMFLPGNTPNMLINGDTLGADALILDLEDAVSPSEKDSARILVRNYLKNLKNRRQFFIVRINSTDTDYWKDDLNEIIPVKPDCIMPTKVNGTKMLSEISDFIASLEHEKGSVKLIPLIETAEGVENAFSIASFNERIFGIALGAEDLSADLHSRRTKEGSEILYARTRLICAARASGVEVFDTPFTDVNDIEGLCSDIKFARGLGFSGKLVISPRHIDYVNELFSPSEQEINYAVEVLECIKEAEKQGKGAVSLHGKMIDAPIVARARQVYEAAKFHHLFNPSSFQLPSLERDGTSPPFRHLPSRGEAVSPSQGEMSALADREVS